MPPQPPRRIDCHTHVGVEMSSYLRGDFPYAQMLGQLVADGSAAGITDYIVFSMVTNLSLGLESLRQGIVSTEGALESVPYAWENRRLLEEVYRLFPAQVGGNTAQVRRVYPLVMADPLRAPDSQVEALRRLRTDCPDYPFYGMKFQTTMLQSPIALLRTTGRALMALAEEWDLTLLIHSSVHPADPWAQASDILDIVEDFPHLRFCVAHSCRFDKVHLDRLAALPNAFFDCSAHRIHCMLAVKNALPIAPSDRRFPSDYTRPATVLRDLAEAYPGKMLWGTDAPYNSFAVRESGISLFSSYADEAACLDALPPALQQEVAWENTRRCFPFLPSGDAS